MRRVSLPSGVACTDAGLSLETCDVDVVAVPRLRSSWINETVPAKGGKQDQSDCG